MTGPAKRPGWRLLLARHQAGESIAELAQATGLTLGWVRTRLRREERTSLAGFHDGLAERLTRQLVQAESALLGGEAGLAERHARAVMALTRAAAGVASLREKEQTGDRGVDDEPEQRLADLDRRLDRLAAAGASPSDDAGDDAGGACGL